MQQIGLGSVQKWLGTSCHIACLCNFCWFVIHIRVLVYLQRQPHVYDRFGTGRLAKVGQSQSVSHCHAVVVRVITLSISGKSSYVTSMKVSWGA